MSVVRWSIGLAILAYCAVPAMAQSSIQTAFNYDFQEEAAAPPAPGAPEHEATAEPAADEASAPCDCASESSSSCCCEASCGCESGCCSSCGCGNGWGNCLGDCCLGDAWTLKDCLTPCCCDYNYGGWISVGYYTDNERFSSDPNDLFSFHDNPDEINFDQVWFFAEKVAEADGCCSDWGYRFDIAYGVDAQKFQAFGNGDNTWDNSFDHGSYGWAIPQAYLEYACGDWSVKAGHFWTIIGYEVVPVTGNFFYSHSFAFFNSEPFTHTGVLSTYEASDCMTYYLGWTLGWDTGFDQFEDGNNFLGGFTYTMSDCAKYTYATTVGDFGLRGDNGYSHSNVLDLTLSDCWQYVLQSDYLHVDNVDGFEETNYGAINYLFYTLNDCWKAGGRMEWWKSNFPTGEATSFFELTGGVNYRAHANLVVRPEVRYNWTPSDEAVDDFDQTLFAVDAVLTF